MGGILHELRTEPDRLFARVGIYPNTEIASRKPDRFLTFSRKDFDFFARGKNSSLEQKTPFSNLTYRILRVYSRYLR